MGGQVRVALDGPIILSGSAVTASLELTSAVGITDTDGTNSTIAKSAVLKAAAGEDIVLGDGSATFRMTDASVPPLQPFDASRYLALQAENVSIEADSGLNLSTASGFNSFTGTVFLDSNGNITQVAHAGNIQPLEANRIAMIGAGAVLFSSLRVTSKVTNDDSTEPNLAIHGGVPVDKSVLSSGGFSPAIRSQIPGTVSTPFSPVAPVGTPVTDLYSIVAIVMGDAKIGLVDNAANPPGSLLGINVSSLSGNVFLQTLPDATTAEAGNLSFTSMRTDMETAVVRVLGGVFTAVASGKLSIDTQQPGSSQADARTTRLTSGVEDENPNDTDDFDTVTSVDFSVIEFNGMNMVEVGRTGPRFILDPPSELREAATTGLVFSPDFEQRVTLAAGSRGEDGILVEFVSADVQPPPSDVDGTIASPEVFRFDLSAEMSESQPVSMLYRLSDLTNLQFRIVTVSHEYDPTFIPDNPARPFLPTTIRLYNAPRINLFDSFDPNIVGDTARDLNVSVAELAPRVISVPTIGFFQISTPDPPATFDPVEPVLFTPVATIPQTRVTVDEIRVSSSSGVEKIVFGRVDEDGNFIKREGEEWPVEWTEESEGDFLNAIREAVEKSPSLEGRYRIESQTPRGNQPLEEFIKQDVQEAAENVEQDGDGETGEAAPQEETGEGRETPAEMDPFQDDEESNEEAAPPAIPYSEYRIQRGVSSLVSGQLVVGTAALAVSRWNRRMAAKGPLESGEAPRDLSRAARRRRAWRKLAAAPAGSGCEVAP
jgi:hypothetical protein